MQLLVDQGLRLKTSDPFAIERLRLTEICYARAGLLTILSVRHSCLSFMGVAIAGNTKLRTSISLPWDTEGCHVTALRWTRRGCPCRPSAKPMRSSLEPASSSSTTNMLRRLQHVDCGGNNLTKFQHRCGLIDIDPRNLVVEHPSIS